MGLFSKKKKPKEEKPDREPHKAEKEREWQDIHESRKYVIHGGKVQCPFCSVPIGDVVVTSNTISLQGKYYATTADCDGKTNFDFKGQCTAAPGITKPPCKSMIQLGQWKDYSETFINDDNALLVQSVIPCNYGSIDIKIVNSGQIEVLSEIEPNVIPYEVEKIEISTPLDLGSDNILNSIGTKDGMIWENTYIFEVEKYVDDKVPVNKQQIKWSITYTNEDGEAVIISLKKRGEKLKFKLDDKELLGRDLTIKAYIDEDSEVCASIEIWSHYMFHLINRETLLFQANATVVTPFLIDQEKSSLCGIAFIGYHFAKQNVTDYLNYIKDMHRTGEAIITKTSYSIEIDSDKHLLKYNPTDKKFPTNLVDFILLVTIKDFINTVWDYDPDGENAGGFVEGGTGLTLAGEIKSLMKNILGCTDIKDETNYVTSKWQSAKSSVEDLQKELSSGYMVALLINASGIISSSKPTFTIPNHWVGLESISFSKDSVSMLIYTWGTLRNVTVNSDHFVDGYFGYVAGK